MMPSIRGHMPFAACRAVARRTWAETGKDNIGLIAAGVAFYGFLALIPLLGATVLVYGIVADPPTVMRDMTKLTSVMPADVAKLIGEQLMNVVKTSDGKKGLGLLIALALALFGARNGAGAVITALNVAYEEQEARSFIHVNLLALTITTAAVIVAMLALAAITALGYLETLIPNAPDILIAIGKIAVYALLMLAGAAGAATLYRYGPSRRRARWIWLTPGSLFAALMWLALTVGFGIYVANFGNYNATYGSLGTVVITLTWLYLSSYILLFGAELNAELEHQTARDTTDADAPIGERGAWVADHVAEDTHTADNATPPQPVGVTAPNFSPMPSAIIASRIVARAGGVAGLPKGGLTATVAANLGLSLLRRGRGWPGLALLGGTAALVWLRRDRSREHTMIKAIVFDVDGTLVDSNEQHVTAWHDAFEEQDLRIDREAIRGQIGKGGDLLVPALVLDASEHMRKLLSKRHGVLFKRAHLDTVKPFPAATALIRRVHESGRRVRARILRRRKGGRALYKATGHQGRFARDDHDR